MRDKRLPIWLTPLWWATGDDPSISREQLIDKWVMAAEKPKPEKKLFVPELKGWSGELGKLRWVADRYTPTAAMYARQSVNSVFNDAQAWWQVSLLYAHYGDPLARFSAQFKDEAEKHRPENLRKPYSGAVRDIARGMRSVAREALLNPQDGKSVLATAEDADQFLKDPTPASPRYKYVHSTVMRAYVAELSRYRDKLATSIRDSGPDLDAQISLNACIDRLTEFAEAADPTRSATDEEKEHVSHLLEELVKANPSLRDRHSEALGEAWERAYKTLTRWVAEGREVTNATILFTKIAAVRTDLKDAEYAYRRRVQSDEGLSTGTDDYSSLLSSTAEPGQSFDAVEYRAIIDRIRPFLNDYPATVTVDGVVVDCWEKQFARTLLDRAAGQLSEKGTTAHTVDVADVDFADVVLLITQEWATGRPANARTDTATKAAKDVQSMLRIAASMIVETTEDLGVGGKKNERRTWRERTAAFTEALHDNRGEFFAETEKQ